MELFDEKKSIIERNVKDFSDLAIYAPNCS